MNLGTDLFQNYFDFSHTHKYVCEMPGLIYIIADPFQASHTFFLGNEKISPKTWIKCSTNERFV